MILDVTPLVDPFVKLVNAVWLDDLTFGSIAIRLVLALICGCIIGAERTLKHQAAGFRTYSLVCLGSAIAMMTNQFIMDRTGLGDQARLGAQVISGIGFLGAGTIIITSRNQIRGLTTAAGLWGCACIGLAIGSGFYTLAILSMAVLMVIFVVLPPIEHIVLKRGQYIVLHIEFECRANLKDFVGHVRSLNIRISSIDHNAAYASSGLSVYTISLVLPEHPADHEKFLSMVKELNYVHHVEEIR